MKSKFPNIIVLLFLGLLLISKESLHNERQSLDANRKSNRKPKREDIRKNKRKNNRKKDRLNDKKSKKETKQIRKRVKKEFKIKSPEPIDPEKIKLRFNLDN